MASLARRQFLKGMAGLGAAGAVISTGLVSMPAWSAAPSADNWPKDAFDTDDVDKTIQMLYGAEASESDKIDLKAPTIAENGAVVPITLETSLDNVTEMALLVPKNPNALTATYHFPEGTLPQVSNRIKMRETSDVVAVVVADGKPYKTTKSVKVTIGGCGG